MRSKGENEQKRGKERRRGRRGGVWIGQRRINPNFHPIYWGKRNKRRGRRNGEERGVHQGRRERWGNLLLSPPFL